jgi:8-oxo-dGTP pyrophosphatase MutT (NUDIX family)
MGAALGVLERVRPALKDERAEFEVAYGVLSRRSGKVSTLELAMAQSAKAFVAHRHCQQLMARRWAGDGHDDGCELRLVDFSASWRAVVGLAIFPFHWVQDADDMLGLRLRAKVMRSDAPDDLDSDNSDTDSSDDPDTDGCIELEMDGKGGTGTNDARSRPPQQRALPGFWHVYSIPAVRFTSRALVTHGGLAAILSSLLAFTPIAAQRALVRLPGKTQARLEIAFAVWALGIGLDYVRTRAARRKWSARGLRRPAWATLDHWTSWTCAALVLMRVTFFALISSGALDANGAGTAAGAGGGAGGMAAHNGGGADGSGGVALASSVESLVEVLSGWLFPLALGACSLVAFGRFVGETLMQLQAVGSLVICASEMLRENVTSWGALMLCLLAGFGLAFTAIAPGYSSGGDDGGGWAERAYSSIDDDDVRFSGASGPFFVPVWATAGDFDVAGLDAVRAWAPALLLIVLLVLSQILMMNLLIAMLTETFTRVMANSQIEWQYKHALLVDWCVSVLPSAPPPFNLVAEPLRLVRACCRPRRAGGSRRPADAAAALPDGSGVRTDGSGGRLSTDADVVARDEIRAVIAYFDSEEEKAATDVSVLAGGISRSLNSLALAQQDERTLVGNRLQALGDQLDKLGARLPDVPRPRPRPNGPRLHVRARSQEHADYRRRRVPVPDAHVPWVVPWPAYEPKEFTSPIVSPAVGDRPAWADPPDPTSLRDLRLRHSHEVRPLVLSPDGRPLNPYGRTGTSGRGLLGKWGPNHAADPIVVRRRPAWDRRSDRPGGSRAADAGGDDDDAAAVHFQLVGVKRLDSGQWALPGGMVHESELVCETLRREFTEEAASHTDPERKAELETQLDQIFESGGELIYEGYCDDPRNTDHAWIETTCRLFLLSDELSDKLPLASGLDTQDVRWLDIDEALLSGAFPLYADHLLYLQIAIERARELHKERCRPASTPRMPGWSTTPRERWSSADEAGRRQPGGRNGLNA